MRLYKLVDNNSSELILFFGGWATDFNPFQRLISDGHDVVMIYDYTTLDGSEEVLNDLFDRYTNIHLIAWSMGVWAASKVFEMYDLPLSKLVSKTAINGTPQAIDPLYGIVPEVFDKTIENLPHGLGRFNLRMCGGKRGLDEYNSSPSMRGGDDIKAELIAIRDLSQMVDSLVWDRAIVGVKDMIFTAENQLRFWREYQNARNSNIDIQELSEPHFIFGRYEHWGQMISSQRVNKELVESRFSHAISSYDLNATAQKEICSRLFNLVDRVDIAPSPRVLEFGCGTGNLSQLLAELNPSELLLNDLCDSYKEVLREKIVTSDYEFVSIDARELIKELKRQNRKFDLIASASALQWIERPLQFLSECVDLLSPNGLLLVSSFAPDNISEVTAITKSGLNYPSLESYKFAFDSTCDIVYLSSESITLYFDSPYEVLSHLKRSGVTASASSKLWTRGDLRNFEREYNEKFREQDLGCPLTYRPLYFVCKGKRQILRISQKNKIMIIDKLPESIFDSKVLFISGIDTNVGKTYATAYLLQAMQQQRKCRVISQKMIQTGCKDISEDIEMHRQLQGVELLPEDLDGTTSPVVLSYPASPHLAAKIDNREIDIQCINDATKSLEQSFDTILLEGAGGLMVPIVEGDSPLGGYLTIDYIEEMNYPVVLVTSGRLGSLNHTLLSIDACKRRNIEVAMIVYNQYPSSDEIIEKSSLEYLQRLRIPIVRLPYIN